MPWVRSGGYDLRLQAAKLRARRRSSRVLGSKDGDVFVAAGSSIQSAVNANPAGTTYIIGGGTHGNQTVSPKAGDSFYGEPGAVMDGTNSTGNAFSGASAANVTVDGILVENYTNGFNQEGHIRLGSNMTVTNCEVRNGSGLGIWNSPDSYIAFNHVHHNQWIGIGGFKAHRSVIENNEVSYNGEAGFSDRGGSKWVGAFDIVVRNNHYHHNWGNGIWLDANFVDALVEGNLIEDAPPKDPPLHPVASKGLHWEAACSGTLRYNTIRRCAHSVYLIADNQTEFHDNTIEDSLSEAIRVGHIDRRESGPDVVCDWIIVDMNIYDNTITGGGLVQVQEYSAVPDPGSIFEPGDTKVWFDRNTYSGGVTFNFPGSMSWAQWQAAGNDPNGSWSA
jgi:hypothetical protein